MDGFNNLCKALRRTSGHLEKSRIISDHLNDYKGDVYMLFCFLLPKETGRIYGLKDKQLINIFSEVLHCEKDDMSSSLNNEEDVAVTIAKFFTKSDCIKPAKKSNLSLDEVDAFLKKLAAISKDESRKTLVLSIIKKCTTDDLISIIRLIRQDMRINAGSKQILDGLHPQAYSAFQVSRDLRSVINKFRARSTQTTTKSVRVAPTSLCLMTPVKPMLAEACRSASMALSKAGPGGSLFAEVKYDGERLQVHKKGTHYSYFSRNLKAVKKDKIADLEPYIPQAFKTADEFVIDGEVLLMDVKNSKPLPFGTLGVHKRTAFADATVCLFVFDCLYLDGQSLLNEPLSERRRLLEKTVHEVPNRIVLSEKHSITKVEELNILLARIFAEKLEGLVLKPSESLYEPGKRHWLKIKRDYLAEGAMADSVDLIVLGAYYGTGSKAGLMSVFLMGAYDPSTKRFATVTKCGNGFSDEMLRSLQTELKMKKISKLQVPQWLNVTKSLIPDFVVIDPKSAPVWEITGAEFSRAGTHTAGLSSGQSQGISIRFPRYTRSRPDKTWQEATNVTQLEQLLNKSCQQSDWLALLNQVSGTTTTKKGSKRKGCDSGKQLAPKKRRSDTTDSKIGMEPRHLNSLFNGVVMQVDESVLKVDPDAIMLLRQLVASGAEFSGDVPDEFDSFVSEKDPTHLLVADNDVQATVLKTLKLSEVYEALKSKRPIA